MKKGRTKRLKWAASLFRKFREEPPTRVAVMKAELPDVLMVMGHVSAIEYETTHLDDEKKKRIAQGYHHDFAPGSRPLLCCAPGKNGLFVVGGRYHVTERGIVDLDAKGREIED
jgi:hypothetical protein